MIQKLCDIVLWPYHAVMAHRLQNLIDARCSDLERDGLDIDPKNVLTPEIIECYIKADLRVDYLERVIKNNAWHEGFNVYRDSPKP